VGEAGLRKGISYAAETARLLVRCGGNKWIGPINLLRNARRIVETCVKLTGPTLRKMMAAKFQLAKVFFLPPVSEGLVIVTYEALVSGLAVITTPNAGIVMIDKVDGFIVAARDQTRWLRDFDTCTCIAMHYLKCRMRRARVTAVTRAG
jgi:glycosyltransferase involved in cell wall biosynthesis